MTLGDGLLAIPQGLYQGANRYDTDNEHVLTIWGAGHTHDLRTPKTAAAPNCPGRHCAHDRKCQRAKLAPGILPSIPEPYQPNSRELLYCTCPGLWNSILPPPPCPAHGTFSMPTVTCTTVSAAPPKSNAVLVHESSYGLTIATTTNELAAAGP